MALSTIQSLNQSYSGAQPRCIKLSAPSLPHMFLRDSSRFCAACCKALPGISISGLQNKALLNEELSPSYMLVIAKSESHRTGSRKEAPCCCCCLKDFSNTGYLQGWVLFIQYRLLKKHGEKAESGGISYPMCGHVHICTHTHLSRGRVYKTDLLSVLIFEVLYVFFFNNAQQKQTPKLCVSFCLSTNCLVH